MKKLHYFVILLPMLLILVSCNSSPPDDANVSEQPLMSADVTLSDMWKVELISAEVSESLLASIAAVQYGGGVVTTENLVEPAGGHVFLLLELNIEKIGTGRAAFSWGDAHITDAGGNVYYRHPNDTFLANLNIPRIRGTDIVLGTEYGFVCFEIPVGADGLRFIADEGRISIQI